MVINGVTFRFCNLSSRPDEYVSVFFIGLGAVFGIFSVGAFDARELPDDVRSFLRTIFNAGLMLNFRLISSVCVEIVFEDAE